MTRQDPMDGCGLCGRFVPRCGIQAFWERSQSGPHSAVLRRDRFEARRRIAWLVFPCRPSIAEIVPGPKNPIAVITRDQWNGGCTFRVLRARTAWQGMEWLSASLRGAAFADMNARWFAWP